MAEWNREGIDMFLIVLLIIAAFNPFIALILFAIYLAFKSAARSAAKSVMRSATR